MGEWWCLEELIFVGNAIKIEKGGGFKMDLGILESDFVTFIGWFRTDHILLSHLRLVFDFYEFWLRLSKMEVIVDVFYA
jgi:hypothetical protein